MNTYTARITRIIDADTFDCDIDLGLRVHSHQRIRVRSYDAPETYRPSCKAEHVHGKKATAFAIKLLENQEVTLTTYKDRVGVYGRWEAEVTLPNGDNFADLMIDNGFAKKDDYPADTE